MVMIDAVYTWVDMSDPKWLKKYKNKMGLLPAKTRYKNYGELEYSIKLIMRYCKFINNIYIVTDEQIPKWYNKDRHKNIKIIFHNQILGEECCKPTFKSDSIESYLHNIPDLSEFFLYLNDDCFIGNHCNESHFINRKGLPIVRFKVVELNEGVKKRAQRGLVFPRAITLTNATQCIERKFRKHYDLVHLHHATMMRKSLGKLAWEYFYDELKKSVSYPTRDPKTHTIPFVNLTSLMGLATNQIVPEINNTSVKIYRNHAISSSNYMTHFNNILRTRPQLFCLNDINDGTYTMFKTFMDRYLTLK